MQMLHNESLIKVEYFICFTNDKCSNCGRDFNYANMCKLETYKKNMKNKNFEEFNILHIMCLDCYSIKKFNENFSSYECIGKGMQSDVIKEMFEKMKEINESVY